MRVGRLSALRWVKCPFQINQEHHISRQINDDEKLCRGLGGWGQATTVLVGHRGAPDVHAYNDPARQQLKAPKTFTAGCGVSVTKYLKPLTGACFPEQMPKVGS